MRRFVVPNFAMRHRVALNVCLRLFTTVGIGASTAALHSAEPAAKRPADAWLVDYVLDDCILSAQISLRDLAQNPVSRPIYEAIKSNPGYRSSYGVPAHVVRDMTVMLTGSSPDEMRARTIFRIDTPFEEDWLKNGGLADSETRQVDGKEYRVSRNGLAWQVIDGDKIVLDSEAGLRELLKNPSRRNTPPAWLETALKLRAKSAWISVDAVRFRHMIRHAGHILDGSDVAFVELIRDVHTLAIGLDIRETVDVRAILNAHDEDSANVCEGRAREFMQWVSNGLQKKYDSPKTGTAVIFSLLQGSSLKSTCESLVSDAKIVRQDKDVLVASFAPFDVRACRALVLVPRHYVETSWPIPPDYLRDLLRVGSAHNLNDLMLAMYAYYREHGSFPAAAILGPDGKTVHSWRIAVLPYLDELDLYRQYKLDEPWDGPNNSKLITQAPDVFRSPLEPPDSVNTSYFVLTGSDTLISLDHGSRIEALNGTEANSILIVESRRDVPWTKPEDVPFDPKRPFPQLGGIHDKLFLCILANGKVRGYPPSYDESKLRTMASKSANKPLEEESDELK